VGATVSSNDLKSGTVRLLCESACTLRWNSRSRHLKALHDNKLWTDLANEVRDIDYVSDLSYYYLGRAAEGLGHTEAAATYYKLALTYLYRCDGWISGCDGFDFPRDIRVRLSGLTAVKSASQSTPTIEPIKIAVVPSLSVPQPIRREPPRSGTGFFIHAEGLMVTSLHVVDKASNIMVTTRGDAKRSAQLLAKNEPCDLAVLKVASSAQYWLPIQRDARKIKRGSEVLTVGFPRVNLQGVESKVTNGLISSLSGVANDPNFFQISVPIQPGNSGGPLVSRDGMVVGVISSKLAIKPSLDVANVQPENVNYAVKSNCLRDVLKTLPAKYRNEMRKSKKLKTAAKAKSKNRNQEMSMVDLTERVEKTVALVTASFE
jgi:S1-C subfamily serine protease